MITTNQACRGPIGGARRSASRLGQQIIQISSALYLGCKDGLRFFLLIRRLKTRYKLLKIGHLSLSIRFRW